MSTREGFEYWASDEGESPKAIERSGHGYLLAQTQAYWTAWQAALSYAAQGQDPVITNEMKYACIGEFSWQEEATYYDEDGELHEDYVATHVVPWDLCKQIYKRMHKIAHPQPAVPGLPLPETDDNGCVHTGNQEADAIINRLNGEDPTFEDMALAVSFIYKLVSEHKGPEGFATWKDAALYAARKGHLNPQPAVPEGYQLVPVAATMKIESAIAASRNLKA